MPHPLPVCRAHARKLAWTSMLHFIGDAALVPACSNITAAVFARRWPWLWLGATAVARNPQ